jgi:hypothetical protein
VAPSERSFNIEVVVEKSIADKHAGLPKVGMNLIAAGWASEIHSLRPC